MPRFAFIGPVTSAWGSPMVSTSLEKPPQELIPNNCAKEACNDYLMVWVDNDMLSIMSGPDWDKGPPKETERRIHRGT